ncbi:MAG TPA: hypothetical protein VF670_02820, partial [Duganella sp.]
FSQMTNPCCAAFLFVRSESLRFYQTNSFISVGIFTNDDNGYWQNLSFLLAIDRIFGAFSGFRLSIASL